MDFDKQRFKERLRILMGSLSATEFANKCGISRANVFRMLNDENAPQPTKTTLRKIAEATGTSIDDLYTICGYASSPAQARQMHSFNERILLNIKDMQEGFSFLTKGARLVNSISDFLEEHIMLYSHEDCKYAISGEKEYDGDLHPAAESYVNCYLVFKDREGTCYTYFVVYFAKTKGGHYVILDTAMDGASLLEAEFATEEQMRRMNIDPEAIRGKDSVYYYRETAEGKLMKAIFGEDNDSYQFPYTLVGFGFEFPVEGDNFRKFIENHKGSFPEGSLPLMFLEDPSADPQEFFENYKDESTYETGFQAVVSNVMRDETSLPFELYMSENGEAGEDVGCIMIVDGLDEYPLEELKEVVSKYAKELGVSQYGECIVYTRRWTEPKHIFKTMED